jgi:hypothetical protein
MLCYLTQSVCVREIPAYYDSEIQNNLFVSEVTIGLLIIILLLLFLLIIIDH